MSIYYKPVSLNAAYMKMEKEKMMSYTSPLYLTSRLSIMYGYVLLHCCCLDILMVVLSQICRVK